MKDTVKPNFMRGCDVMVSWLYTYFEACGFNTCSELHACVSKLPHATGRKHAFEIKWYLKIVVMADVLWAGLLYCSETRPLSLSGRVSLPVSHI